MNRSTHTTIRLGAAAALAAAGAAPAQVAEDAFDYQAVYEVTGDTIGDLLRPMPPGDWALDDPTDNGSVRRRAVQVDFGVLEAIDPGERVRLELFEDTAYEVVFERREVRGPREYTWFGRLAGLETAHVTVTRCEDAVYAGVRSYDERRGYQVRWRGGPWGIVRETSPLSTARCGDPKDQPPPAPKGGAPDAACNICGTQVQSDPGAADAGYTVDVLVVYTPQARDEEGGVNAMNALIGEAIADMNTRLANSQCQPRVRLVWRAEMIGYVENGSDELSRLRCPTDGHMDAAHALRDAHSADLVCCIVRDIDDNCGLGCVIAGVAYRLQGAYGNDCNPVFYAFSIVDNNYADDGTFAHELGHSLGCCHDRANGCDNPIAPYAFGRCFYAGWGFYTTMAYDCAGGLGTKIPYYSNPNLTYNGQRIGTAGWEDNHRQINDARVEVANWRQGDHQRWVFFNPLPGYTGNGSQLLPYARVSEGINGVATGGTVSIFPGTYAPGFNTITKAVTLRAATGPVILTP